MHISADIIIEFPYCVGEMANNKNEVVCVLPIRNVNGGYMKKTYTELIEEISPDEIDELYCYLEQLTEKNVSKNVEW